MCVFNRCFSLVRATNSEILTTSHATNPLIVSGGHTIRIIMRRTQTAARHSNQCNSAKASREVIAEGGTITIINELSCRAHSSRYPDRRHIVPAPKAVRRHTILKSHLIEGGIPIERLRRAIRFKAEPKKSQKRVGPSGKEFLKPVAGVGTGFRDRHVELSGVPIPHQAKTHSPGRFAEMPAHVIQHVAAGNQV